MRFRELVEQEKQSSRANNGPFNSMHEIYGVLAEELFEFFETVMQKPSERNAEEVLHELVQIASSAENAAEDMGLVEKVQGDTDERFYQFKYNEQKDKINNFLNKTIVLNKLNNLQPTKDLTVSNVKYLVIPSEEYEKFVEEFSEQENE